MPRTPSTSERTTALTPEEYGADADGDQSPIEDALDNDLIRDHVQRICSETNRISRSDLETVLSVLADAGGPVPAATLADETGYSKDMLDSILLQLHYCNITYPATMGEQTYIGFHPDGLDAVRRAHNKHRIRLAAIDKL